MLDSRPNRGKRVEFIYTGEPDPPDSEPKFDGFGPSVTVERLDTDEVLD